MVDMGVGCVFAHEDKLELCDFIFSLRLFTKKIRYGMLIILWLVFNKYQNNLTSSGGLNFVNFSWCSKTTNCPNSTLYNLWLLFNYHDKNSLSVDATTNRRKQTESWLPWNRTEIELCGLQYSSVLAYLYDARVQAFVRLKQKESPFWGFIFLFYLF